MLDGTTADSTLESTTMEIDTTTSTDNEATTVLVSTLEVASTS